MTGQYYPVSTVIYNIVFMLTQGHGSTGLGCSIVLFLLDCMGVLHSHVSKTSPLHACTVREGVQAKAGWGNTWSDCYFSLSLLGPHVSLTLAYDSADTCMDVFDISWILDMSLMKHPPQTYLNFVMKECQSPTIVNVTAQWWLQFPSPPQNGEFHQCLLQYWFRSCICYQSQHQFHQCHNLFVTQINKFQLLCGVTSVTCSVEEKREKEEASNAKIPSSWFDPVHLRRRLVLFWKHFIPNSF